MLSLDGVLEPKNPKSRFPYIGLLSFNRHIWRLKERMISKIFSEWRVKHNFTGEKHVQ
jgi:hypothetical protein